VVLKVCRFFQIFQHFFGKTFPNFSQFVFSQWRKVAQIKFHCLGDQQILLIKRCLKFILLKKYCEIYMYIYQDCSILAYFSLPEEGGSGVEALIVYNENPFCWEGIILLRQMFLSALF
jgi:hypothetical protein